MNITKSELIEILKSLSVLEGFLWSQDSENTHLIFEGYLDNTIKMIVEKLEQSNDEQ